MKKIISFILSIGILVFSFVVYNIKKPVHNLSIIEEMNGVNDLEIYKHLDRAVFQVTAGPESGTAFLFDEDLVNNKLYLMTNMHVIDSLASGKDVVLTPNINSKLPVLCGKVIAHGGDDGIDVAFIEAYAITYKQCNVKVALDLSTFAGQYDLVKMDRSLDLLESPFDQHYYTVGYPAIIYRRDKFIFTGEFPDERFIIDKIVWQYKHFNFSYSTLPGSSGSPIVNHKGEFFAILSTNIGGVGYVSVYQAMTKMCNQTKLQIKSC